MSGASPPPLRDKMAESICLCAKKGELEEVTQLLAGGWDKDATVPDSDQLHYASAEDLQQEDVGKSVLCLAAEYGHTAVSYTHLTLPTKA